VRALRRLPIGAARALADRAELDAHRRRQFGADAGLGLGLRNGDPKPGERVVSGFGHLALQLSKAVGHETAQADKKTELVALGADEVLLSGDDPGAALRDAGGADVIISTTNSAKQIAAAFNGLRPGGRFVNLGMPDGPLTISSQTLMWGQRQLRGSSQDERADL
jgi:D-arabinose 1-dehydrogenase-like Zn-dependent alcohol dehydrogenase